MRFVLVSFLFLPLAACMTQRDKTVWEEFKVEISNLKSEGKKEAAEEAPAALDNAAAAEAVAQPAPVDKP